MNRSESWPQWVILRRCQTIGTKAFLGIGCQKAKRDLEKKHMKNNQELVDLAKNNLEKIKSVTYDTYKIINRRNKNNKQLETFQVALNVQAEDLIGDLFPSRRKKIALQDLLLFET